MLKDATNDVYIRDNLINSVNVDARPIGGTYQSKENGELHLAICSRREVSKRERILVKDSTPKM